MEDETITEQIERTQRELAGIREYHQEYLDYRVGRGRATKTDKIMTEHQRQLEAAVKLLAFLKECYPVYNGYELYARVVHPRLGIGTVMKPRRDEYVFVQFDIKPSLIKDNPNKPVRLDLRFAKLRHATRHDEAATEVD